MCSLGFGLQGEESLQYDRREMLVLELEPGTFQTVVRCPNLTPFRTCRFVKFEKHFVILCWVPTYSI
ncbi:hypothetical protein UPYG_G00155390 [Umbra pygmaea]|uniref:Uncharacterized protein n=1 Tax=Umbra pygmaea TaxID=75934 RepID=A0ABD0WYH6_UMBPY